MTEPIEASVFSSALAYHRTGGISLAQSFLKHSLVPLRLLVDHMPKEGLILDLGCGEGILANLVARALPGCRIVGYDLDQERVEIATRNAPPNAAFEVRDIFDLPELVADGAILNDVVHHLPFRRHRELLAGVLGHLRPGAPVVHKEVDRRDRIDRGMTRFFDSRLYPHDPLSFRTAGDWLALWKRLGVRDVRMVRQRHLWPASRTMFLFHRPEDTELHLGEETATIGAGNTAAGPDTVTVFLTGGTGFIGGHLARRLLAKGLGRSKVRLILLIRDTDGMPADLAAAGSIPLYGDLNDLPNLRSALSGVDYVFHLAAEVKLTDGEDLWRNNHEGTLDLLDALQRYPIKRFVHASTMGAVDRAAGDPCTSPLDESVPPNPLSEYGRTKLAAEKAVIESGLPYSILRVPWSYGPGMTPDTHVRFLTQGVVDGKLFSWFNFPGRVSLITVEDLVSAFIMMAERHETEAETYYVSDGTPLALGSLFQRAGNLIGRRSGFVNIPRLGSAVARRLRRFLPLSVQNLNSDVLTVSNTKIAALGFRPHVSMRQGLNRLLQDLGFLPQEDRALVTVLTGAGSGIGRALARVLKEEGHAMLLVDNDTEALQDIAEELAADSLALDLTDLAAADALEAQLEDRGYRLDWFVNNAGIGLAGASADLRPGCQEQVIDLNCRALTSLSRIALRHFRERGRGTLINIASSSGFQPLPFMAAYAASKAYVQSYSRALRGEMKDCPGILVMTVNPSGTATSFQAKALVKQNENEVLLRPEHVARKIVAAAHARRSEVTMGWSGKAMSMAARLLPYSVQVRLWGHLMTKLRMPSES